MIVMPGIMRGRRTLFDGFVMDLMSSTFRATVPTTQTRTFQETHVYTGGTKWLLKANGFLGSTTAPEEPVLYNTSGTRLGIVLEPAATNLLLQSQAFTTTWTTTNLETPTTGFTAPDGTSTAWKCIVSNGLSFGRIQQTITLSGATAYRVSIFAKAGEWGWLGIRVAQDAADACYFNLSSGVVGTAVGLWTNTTIEAFPNGWYRCSATYTTVGTSYTFRFAPTNVDASFSTGDGTSGIYMWGAQCEAGSSATSYIPTTTASVTRTADSCKPALPTTLAAPYSMYIDHTVLGPSGTNIVGDAVGYGSTTNGVGLYYTAGQPRAWVQASGAGVANVNSGLTATYGIAVKAVARFATNDVNAAANNNIGTADTSAAIISIDNAIGFGTSQVAFGGNNPNQLLRAFRIYASGLIDSDLQTLSNGVSISSSPVFNLNYETGSYTYTPVNAGTTTTYSLSTLISSGLMTLTGSPSAKWVRGSNGLLQQVAAGSLAIEYDASGNVLGCINTEPARTNRLNRSQDIPTGCTGSNYTLSATGAGVTTPDGATTASRITETATTSARFCYHAGFNGTGGVTYAQSIFVRAGVGRTAFFLNIQQSAGNYITAVFDLTASAQTGTASETSVGGTSGTIVSTRYERFSDGWYRLSIVGSTAGANSFCFGNAPAATGNAFTTLGIISFTGNTNNYTDVWQLQAEDGSYASSIIPTVAISVTRNADVWTLNLGSWFDNSKWIVASKVYAPRANMRDGANAAAALTLFNASESTADYFQAYVDSTNRIDFAERVASVNGASGFATSLSYPAVVRYGFGFAPSNAKPSVNGSTQTLTGTPSAIQAAFTKVGLGRSFSNPTYGSVYIQSLNIFPVVPTQSNVNQYASGA